jgi:hypothetical protein
MHGSPQGRWAAGLGAAALVAGGFAWAGAAWLVWGYHADSRSEDGPSCVPGEPSFAWEAVAFAAAGILTAVIAAAVALRYASAGRGDARWVRLSFLLSVAMAVAWTGWVLNHDSPAAVQGTCEALGL